MDTGYECYQCHSKDKMDLLVLQDGKTVTIDDSHLLCGECHSLVKRDWDKAIHGKQVGSWSGTKHRYTCADCHDPHKPKRDKMKARPAPPRPKYGIDKGH